MTSSFAALNPNLQRSRPVPRRALLGVFGATLLGCAGVSRTVADAPQVQQLNIAGSTLELQFAPGFDDPLPAIMIAWVRRCADAVAAYFGRFPLPQVELLFMPEPGAGLLSGGSYAEPSPLLRLRIGRDTKPEQFAADWILVHEMVHLAIPRVPRAQNWLHEGIATYVEALARGRAGLLEASTVWFSWRDQMPQGLPREGDAGLDHTPTWARTYWGGALFCLLADVRLRQAGNVQQGLQQALQGVLAAGGDFRSVWTAQRVLATADAALHQTTLVEMHELMKDRPVAADLPALWRDLGVEPDRLRDDAPLASIRRAILG